MGAAGGAQGGVASETGLGECAGCQRAAKEGGTGKLNSLGASVSSPARWGQSLAAGLSDVLYCMCL